MSGIRNVAVLLCGDELSQSEKNLLQIAGFFGLEVIRVSLSEPRVPETDGEYCLLSSAAALAKATGGAMDHLIIAAAKATFVFEFAECEQLLPGLHARPQRAGAAVAISKEQGNFCGPMQGVEFASTHSGEHAVFETPKTDRQYESLMTYGGAPVLLKVGQSVYVTTGGIEVDLSAPVSGHYFDIKQYRLGALALVMYLRWAFDRRAWTPGELNASVIIDDPLLKSRYGFLVFRDVLSLMERHNFSTTIAFIPWNWRRTRRKTAALFLQYPERYSLVVHGNDHTGGEFGSRSLQALDQKIKTAVRRMEAHETRTGIETVRVMVFPQGVFSGESLTALKHNNFVAAVNTEVGPAGSDAPKTEIGQLWNTATMKFSSFPLFTRRYMEHGIENFAFDLLLGKPCLLVGHHEVFKDGAERLVEFVRALNSLNCSLRWRGLGDTVRRSFREREHVDGTLCVQMFANEMFLKSQGTATIRIRKEESDLKSIRQVSRDGQAIPWEPDGDEIRFCVEARAGETVRVAVEYKDSPMVPAITESIAYRIKCGLRRHLSEVRDDYVCRSAFLGRYASNLLRSLR